ncbi:MAG TPA: hypothetical protein VGF95_07585 [Solirubrobacteraceae bacterium]|jgi:hypothetical protein
MLACLAHWTTAGLYAAPVALIAGWLFYANRRDRSRGGRSGGPPADGTPPASLQS